MKGPAGILLTACVVSFGCSPATDRGGFHSDNPGTKLYAIRDAGRSRDGAAVRDLVEQLDHDDPAVRMLAIQALQRITGTRLGYNPYSQPADREQAIERWKQAVRSGRYEQQDGELTQRGDP
jgi:hypothetical protein